MSAELFISIVSLVVTCICFGFMLGKDTNERK